MFDRGVLNRLLWILALALIAGCTEEPDDDDVAVDDDTADDDAADDDDDDVADDDDSEDCPDGMICVDSFPFVDANDTSVNGAYGFDSYSCSPDTDESGPELIYRVELPADGFVGVAVDDSTPGVDIDVHILDELDPECCIDRGNTDAGADLDAGFVYVIADTYVSGGEEQAGPYTLTIGHLVPASGDCSMEAGTIARVGDGGDHLVMPATGPVVLEAHLVTVDDGFGQDWPTTITDGVDDHHEQSQDFSGLVMAREQPWAPQESCEYGQGAYGAKLPVEDEHWYICMYWQNRPDAGTRMIVMTPDGRAVVAAAGYETGPGDLSNVAGATEEVHHYLGTGHQGSLTVGFAVDQSLPLGPITCD